MNDVLLAAWQICLCFCTISWGIAGLSWAYYKWTWRDEGPKKADPDDPYHYDPDDPADWWKKVDK